MSEKMSDELAVEMVGAIGSAVAIAAFRSGGDIHAGMVVNRDQTKIRVSLMSGPWEVSNIFDLKEMADSIIPSPWRRSR